MSVLIPVKMSSFKKEEKKLFALPTKVSTPTYAT
jgi:hypothetical protein